MQFLRVADPDDKRTLAEFCESGAKAIADEATTKSYAGIFAKYSVEELPKNPTNGSTSRAHHTPMICAKMRRITSGFLGRDV